MSEEHFIRVMAVANWRKPSIHGITRDLEQSQAWVRELIDQYGSNDAGAQYAWVVDIGAEVAAAERRGYEKAIEARFEQVGWMGPYGIIPGGMDNDPWPTWKPIYMEPAAASLVEGDGKPEVDDQVPLAEPAPPKAIDLMANLRASLDRAKARRGDGDA